MTIFKEIDEIRRLLGLNEVAILKEIKRAYRMLAHRHHHDRYGGAIGEETEGTIKRVNWAYKLFMDY